jgi:enterochelin esterase-like enzyme
MLTNLLFAATLQTTKPNTSPPKIHTNGSVTFEFHAPEAKQVTFRIDGIPPTPMTKNGNGKWTLTTKPLAPDVYTYEFYIGQTLYHDPKNSLTKPIHGGGSQSILEIDGGKPQIWKRATKRRGTLVRHEFKSKTFGEKRCFLVYLPIGWKQNSAKKLPALYLLHGAMDNEYGWLRAGHADAILDNLIESRGSKPMALIMPLGYGMPNSDKNLTKRLFGASPKEHQAMLEQFREHFLTEVISEVERSFPVDSRPENRAIAGLSMGGTQSIHIALNNPGKFCSVASFAGAMMIFGNTFDPWFPDIGMLRSLRITLRCGDKDFVLASNESFRKWLTGKKVSHQSLNTPGAHEWNVWIRDLAAYLPTLFQNRSLALTRRATRNF